MKDVRNSKLTSSERNCILAWKDLKKFRGMPPTFSEMASHMGVSKTWVALLVISLKKKGFAVSEKRKARSLLMLEPKG